MKKNPTERRGRPKKPDSLGVDVRVRIATDTNEKLLDYCQRHEIQRAPAIRRAIVEMLDRENSGSTTNADKTGSIDKLLDF